MDKYKTKNGVKDVYAYQWIPPDDSWTVQWGDGNFVKYCGHFGALLHQLEIRTKTGIVVVVPGQWAVWDGSLSVLSTAEVQAAYDFIQSNVVFPTAEIHK